MSEEATVGSVFVSNYPPYSFWQRDRLARVEAVLGAPPRPATPLGLYLHIPFCRRRCRFCYFRVYTEMDAKQILRYLESLIAEVEILARQPAIAGRQLEFVYFGGGTPSFISVEHLQMLVGRLQEILPWDGSREVTFECEPGTLSRPKLETIRDIGVTRLSLGIESFDDEILRLNGRAHSSSEIDRVRPWIRDLQFDQLNVDLIAGMLGETWETWRTSVRRAIDYDPDSVTIYQLELPYNTTFTKDLEEGRLEVPVADWETKRAWHDWAFAEIEAAGYVVSSAYTMVRRSATPPEFVYRNSVWNGCDLIGTGVASFSHMSGVHYQNLDSWGPYLDRVEAGELPLGRAFDTSPGERLTRELILQLKLGRLDPAKFHTKFQVDILDRYRSVLDQLRTDEMIRIDDGIVELTRTGLLRVDRLLPRFYDSKYQDARYT